MRWLIVILALAGCYSPRGTRCEPCSGIAECPGGIACISGTCQEIAGACEARDDSGTEAMPPSEGGDNCLGVDVPPFLRICPNTIMSGSYSLPIKIDTSMNSPDCTEEIPQAGAASICVIAADRISVPGVTRIEGPRPVALFGRLGVDVTGTLDLAGHNDDAAGRPPAAGANNCKETLLAESNSAGMGAGGVGATFRARGGGGGAGVMTNAGTASAVMSGVGLKLRGGCRAANGGTGSTQNPAGLGGNGGGAIYILAPLVQITNTINASGGGARAGSVTAGGAGGGSGGMILLWANPGQLMIPNNARIFALGGGGGAGGGSTTGLATTGHDPTGPMDGADLSAPESNGAFGGRGGNETMFAGEAGASSALGGGGGGGGGSTGFIMTIPAVPANMLVFGPPPTTP